MQKSILKSTMFSNIENIEHAFTTRHSSLEAKHIPFLKKEVFYMNQVHGSDTYFLINPQDKNFIENHESIDQICVGKYDALITSLPNTAIAIKSADCTPLLIYDPSTHTIGVIHAGWRSASDQIIEKTIKKMIFTLKSDVSKIKITIGPSICKNCFEVGEEVIHAFEKHFNANFSLFYTKKSNENNRNINSKPKFFLDLKGIIKKQLLNLGIFSNNIDDLNRCTKCEPDTFHSYRRNKTKERQWSVIALKNSP